MDCIRRMAKLRSEMEALKLDAWYVLSKPNVTYMSGFLG